MFKQYRKQMSITYFCKNPVRSFNFQFGMIKSSDSEFLKSFGKSKFSKVSEFQNELQNLIF